MKSLPGTLWGYTGSLDMLGYKEMKSLTSLQEMVLFIGLSDQSLSGVSVGRRRRRKLNAGWITSIWYCGMVLVVHRNSFEN
jgi:hypothetical protein